MAYTYSICYPDKAEIEYKNNIISADEALNIAKNHPWLEQLALTVKLDQNKLYFSPSLDFRSTKDRKSLELTAIYDDSQQLEFSLWFGYPKKNKASLELLDENEDIAVDDVWSIDFETAIKYLEHFLNEEYEIVESLFKNK